MWGWLRRRRAEKCAVEQLRDAEARLRRARREGFQVDRQAQELRDLSSEELADRISRAFGRGRPA